MNDLKLEREVNAVFLSRPARHERGERLRHGFHEFSRMVLDEKQSVLIRAIRVYKHLMGLRHGFHEFSRMVLDEKQSVLIRAIRVFSAIRVHSCPFVVSTSIT